MYEIHFNDITYNQLSEMQSWAKLYCKDHESVFLEPYFNPSLNKTYGFFSFDNKKDADFFSLRWGSNDYTNQKN